jgi:hypothetical protein
MQVHFLAIISSSFFFLVSLLVFPFFQGGDQLAYRGFYQEVSGLNLFDAFDFYRGQLGTVEPFYFLFVYVLSPVFEKDMLLSLANFSLVYFVNLWLIRNKVNFFVYLLLVPNFYLVVLLFSAERLKFALLFFLMGLACRGYFRGLLFGFSVFAHIQVLMLVLVSRAKTAVMVIDGLIRGRLSRGFFVLLATLFFLPVVFFVFYDHLTYKLTYYLSAGGVYSMIKPLFFMFASIYYARGGKSEAFLASLPLVLISFFVGSDRVVIFSYFVFMYYGLRFNGGLNFLVLLSGAYFAFKGIDFIYRIFEFGDGFYGVSYNG